MRRLTVVVAAQLLLSTSLLEAQAVLPYRDATLPIEARVHDLLGRMTRVDKFWQLFMIPGDRDDPAQDYSHGIFGLQIVPAADSAAPSAVRDHAERINRIQHYFVDSTRLGIPIIPFEEGLHGVVREGSTVFPQAIGLAATFDTALMGQVANAIAIEARSRGIRQLLSPVVNVANDVRWGRTEETYGEDPWLASMMAAAYVGAVERNGVIATPKHLVANVGDGGRDSYPVEVSDRRLTEYFFPPFRSAIERGGAQSVMSAYNSVNGEPASQNRWLLTATLREQWGFRGFVISDAAATAGATVLHHTESSTASAAQHALEAGLDVIFQSTYPQHAPYLAAFEAGVIPDSVIDVAVTRVLRAKFALGLFEHPFVDPERAAAESHSREHVELARRAAEESVVLLQNRRHRLPLPAGLGSVALIGGDAAAPRLGGYSGPATHAVSILQALRARLGTRRVVYAAGPGRTEGESTVVPASALSHQEGAEWQPGLHGEYFDHPEFTGSPKWARTDSLVDFSWTLSSPGAGIEAGWFSVRWSGALTVPAGGVRRLGVTGSDGYRLFVDDRLLIDNRRNTSAGSHLVPVSLGPGRHSIRLEFHEVVGNSHVRLVWQVGAAGGWQRDIADAVSVARRASVAIVVAGLEEGEFRDRSHLGLPGHQEELIRAVARTGTPVVVVLVGGSAVIMNGWNDQVDAILDAWYPGEQGGPALARILFGEADPAGRLPISWPQSEGQLPLVYDHEPTGRGDDYLDGTGLAAYPFGFGLSFTEFAYSDPEISPATIGAADSALIRVRVRNTGTRRGDEVVQLYLHDVLASVAQPVLALRGAQRIHLEAGEEREVVFTVGPDDLALLNREMRWQVEPGEFEIRVGASSRDIRLRGTLTVR